MRGKKGKMTGGEEGKNLIVMPLLTTYKILALSRANRVLGFLLCPLITWLFFIGLWFYWQRGVPRWHLSWIVWRPWSVFVPIDPLLSSSEDSRHKHTDSNKIGPQGPFTSLINGRWSSSSHMLRVRLCFSFEEKEERSFHLIQLFICWLACVPLDRSSSQWNQT